MFIKGLGLSQNFQVSSVVGHPVGAELALIVVPTTLVMVLEELQKIYFIQKSSEFNFQEVRQG